MKGGLASAFCVGQRKIVAEGAVDEFGAGIGVKQHDADVELVERVRQPRGGGVVLALQREGIHQSLPQQPGDGSRSARGHRQHREPNEIADLVAGDAAMIEEEQR